MNYRQTIHAVTALLLIVFSVGTVYDPCAEEWRMESLSHSDPLAFSEDSTPSSPSSDLETADCHCLCHFSFRPANDAGVEGSSLHQPLVSNPTEFLKTTPADGILRPPILL